MDPVLLYREFSPAPIFVELGRDLIKVYFNQTSSEVTVPAMDEGQEPVTATEHTAWHVDVAPNYDSIISGIIRTKYSQDDVEAILCNYIEQGENEEHETFIAWRKMAKETAKQVLEALGK